MTSPQPRMLPQHANTPWGRSSSVSKPGSIHVWAVNVACRTASFGVASRRSWLSPAPEHRNACARPAPRRSIGRGPAALLPLGGDRLRALPGLLAVALPDRAAVQGNPRGRDRTRSWHTGSSGSSRCWRWSTAHGRAPSAGRRGALPQGGAGTEKLMYPRPWDSRPTGNRFRAPMCPCTGRRSTVPTRRSARSPPPGRPKPRVCADRSTIDRPAVRERGPRRAARSRLSL